MRLRRFRIKNHVFIHLGDRGLNQIKQFVKFHGAHSWVGSPIIHSRYRTVFQLFYEEDN